ncbi:LCP family protein [Thalassobacillus devorans]|uniref:LCP family protein n=1 Tax=Thalassobacillus devorans TaxID=279813 RepID=UPI000A1C872C|nr:LCP family protein [Thalassobacillus devorans]
MAKKTAAPSRTMRRKKRKLRKRAFFVLIPLLAFFAVAGYAGYLYFKAETVFSDSYVEEEREKSPLRDAEVNPSLDNVSILIMGVDSNDHRDNAGSARTDALMLATFNKDEKSVNLLSIPRDSLVYIPKVGYEDKINHAHAYGGPTATIETVENLLDIPVDYYIKVNFHAFVDVVDALNGVTVDVPYEFKESNSMDKRDAIHLYAGTQKVNGEEALALARTRKLDNDIERGKRQQEIMSAVIKKATSVNSLLNYDEVLTAVGDNMTTNMTFSDMKTFISYGSKGTNLDINTHTLQGYDHQPGSTYYWALDQQALTETQSMLQQHLEISNPVVESSSSSEYAEPAQEDTTIESENY